MARGIVRINTYDQRSTAQGTNTPYKRAVDVRNNIAPALNQASQALSDYGETLARANAAELDNELADRIRDRLYNTETGYLTTARGGNASARRAEIEAAIRDEAAQIGGRARNNISRQLYEDVAARRAAQALDLVSRHDAQETQRYIQEQSEARISRASDLIALGANDEDIVQEQLATIDAEIAEAAQRNGWDEETTAFRRMEVRSQVFENAIRILADQDPVEAQEMYDIWAPGMSAETRADLSATIRGARQRLEERTVDEAWGYVAAGQRIPPEVWARVPGRAQVNIQDYIRQRAANGSAASIVRDPERLRALERMTLRDDTTEFAQMDLEQEIPAIGHDAFMRLRRAQIAIRNGGETEETQTIAQRRTEFNALREDARIQVSPYLGQFSDRQNDNSAGSSAREAFDAALYQEFSEFRSLNPNTPLDALTAQRLTARAMLRLRDDDISDAPRPSDARYGLRVSGDRGLTRGRLRLPGAAPGQEAPIEVVVPYDMIPVEQTQLIGRRLMRLGIDQPTRGEIQNAYAIMSTAEPMTSAQLDQLLRDHMRTN